MSENLLKSLVVLALFVGLAIHKGWHRKLHEIFFGGAPPPARGVASRAPQVQTSGKKIGGFDQRSAEIVGDSLTWLEGGEAGKPTVLLLHPFGVDNRVWIPVATKLRAAGLRVVMPDLSANLGRGDVPAAAKRVRAIMSHAKAGRSNVVGAGLGGTIAAALACAAPAELATLTLIEPLGFGSPYKSDFDRLLEKGRNPLIPTAEAQLDGYFRLLLANPDALGAEELKRLGDRALAEYPAREKLWEACFGAEKGRILDVLIPEIAVKTLIVWGAKSRIAPPENAEGLRLIMENARASSIPNAGHLVMVDQPDLLVVAIREFIGV